MASSESGPSRVAAYGAAVVNGQPKGTPRRRTPRSLKAAAEKGRPYDVRPAGYLLGISHDVKKNVQSIKPSSSLSGISSDTA